MKEKDMKTLPRKNEFWVVDMQMAPGMKMIRTVVNIYRVDKEGDVGFTMCGDDSTYWRSQFEWFEPIRKVELK